MNDWPWVKWPWVKWPYSVSSVIGDFTITYVHTYVFVLYPLVKYVSNVWSLLLSWADLEKNFWGMSYKECL